MKLSFAVSLIIAASFAAHAQTAMPRLASVEPENGKVGTEIVVTGENLTKDSVAKLYLTDGTNDMQVEIIEQTATTIKFRIPPKAKPGRLSLMVLTAGKDAKLIEEPVKVTVDEP
jgi:hypothetical protein